MSKPPLKVNMPSITIKHGLGCLQVENLVNIELSYINTKHPDFTEAGLVNKALIESMEPDMRKVQIQAPTQMLPNSTMQQRQVGPGDDRVCVGWAALALCFCLC